MLTSSGTCRLSLSSMLVDVDEPTVVELVELPAAEVVELPAALVDVVPGMLVDVEDEDDEESWSMLVDVDASTLVEVEDEDVEESGTVPSVDDVETSADTVADVSVAAVTEVELPSSPLAQATPTTARPATTEVNTASIFLIIRYLLGESFGVTMHQGTSGGLQAGLKEASRSAGSIPADLFGDGIARVALGNRLLEPRLFGPFLEPHPLG